MNKISKEIKSYETVTGPELIKMRCFTTTRSSYQEEHIHSYGLLLTEMETEKK